MGNVDHFQKRVRFVDSSKSALGSLMAPHASPKGAHMSYVARVRVGRGGVGRLRGTAKCT